MSSRRYEREYYYWELTILGRRALLVVILVLAQNFAGVQIALGMCVVVTATTLHFAAQPFVSDSLDSLETFTLMSLVGLLCSGILFFGDLRQDGSPQLLLAATSLTYLSIFGCGLFVIIMVVYDVKYEEAIKKVSRRMRKSIKIVLDRCSPSGEDPLWTSSKGTNSVINSIINLFQHRSFKFSKNRVASHPESEPEKHRKSVEGDQGEEETTRDQQNTTAAEFPSQPLDRKRRRPPVKQIPNVERIRLHEKWSKLATALNAEELELHRTIKVREVMKWLNKLEVTMAGGACLATWFCFHSSLD